MWLMYLSMMAMIVIGTTLLRLSLVRGALIGIAVGSVLALVTYVVSPGTCFQQAKGFRILTAVTFC